MPRTSSGNIDIQARLLSLEKGGQISSRSFDAGRSGNILINTREAVTLNNSTIGSDAVGAAEAGGDIQIQTGQLSLLNNAAINAETSSNFQPGNVGQGNAGNITITAKGLFLRSAGRISASSSQSRGNAGNITIRADDMEITGFLRAADLINLGVPVTLGDLLPSQITSDVTGDNINNTRVQVQGGTITIDADRLRLDDGGTIRTNVQQARGQAGNIIVRAADSIEISGRPRFNSPSGLSSSLQADGIGRGGSIQITTGRLNLSDGGEISAATTSQGDAGSVSINASDVDLRGLNTAITTQVDDTGKGNGGDLNIQAQRLVVQDNAQVNSNTFGTGNAGNLTVRANEIELTDTPDLENANTGLFTIVFRGAVGNAGNLTIETDRLTINSGAGISSGTLGQGNAGDVSIQADEQVSLNNGNMASSVATEATGNGGRLSIINLAIKENAI